MTNIPIFGEKLDGIDYQARYGVYGLVTRNVDKEICLLETPNGAFYLPGGEIEADENHEMALEREFLEELGATLEIGDYLGQADEYFYSSHRDRYYYNPAYLYETKNVAFVREPLEKGNVIHWFPFDEAFQKLKRGSHKWALEEYRRKHT